ncbi:type II toxin-antitoxin system RelE/ParE family toxin [Afifella marina]|uniref:Plasmid stabilization system protein ParE n=1 Tax=Afifella marina DSM 2698 TaxID=1120955 RepID=A0A1G5NRL4_AFIMA|nr:type II toxin-antitoxin system RelE/ParE family toxin [Afifella marina]MBK1624664.1 type II toxin-antitoxin system RelE/ParE family toxin [Afifella marina DSM 2698]MBK1627400.1 type II toxin-antitoxin system RelE/ParE family toxin [Afifella marina]MBK5915835.1 plasmid stabilization protein [Afifella marina]RAI20617.1 plasmid stabilization protein [Afifella marina DSM 2698]SCZ39391.1 Plasmid stabilization system protein ParE [Afifella marina DSM 2698]
MKRPVTWSRAALDNVKEQVRHIAKDRPAAARLVADRIEEAGKVLGEMATGRPGRVTGTYEKPVPRLPLIIAYELREAAGLETVVILRIIHKSRDWPAEEWPD